MLKRKLRSPFGGESIVIFAHFPIAAALAGPDWMKSRTEADSDVTPSCGMGIVYVRTASSSTI